MPTKIFACAALLLAVATIFLAVSQQSALQVGQDNQQLYAPRYGTRLSGYYRDDTWVRFPNRDNYGGFPGGGPGVGK